MKILHYSLGLHPFRSGGLAKYSTDLMRMQIEMGNKVYLVYPGKIDVINRKIRIHRTNDDQHINIFEMINPLPIPLLQGINEPELFMKNGDIDVFRKLISVVKPDIIHIHTLMGLYREFFDAAHLQQIKIVYTTHDYFGLCPKAVLYDGKDICHYKAMGNYCTKCNETAFPYWKMVILQSHVYKKYKSTSLLSKIRKESYNKINDIEAQEKTEISKSINYDRLNEYYRYMFSRIDYFHFNSKMTEYTFKKYLPDINGQSINVTHNNISDNRIERAALNPILRVAYLTSCSKFKGFDMLMQAIDELHKENYSIQLNVYNNYESDRSYIKSCGMFAYDDLPQIYSHVDLVVVPSLWYETFGFLTLEALSYGMPVVVTQLVGSKDLIKDGYTGWIIEPNLNSLKQCLINICNNMSILQVINHNILNEKFNFSFTEHAKLIDNFYTECIQAGGSVHDQIY